MLTSIGESHIKYTRRFMEAPLNPKNGSFHSDGKILYCIRRLFEMHSSIPIFYLIFMKEEPFLSYKDAISWRFYCKKREGAPFIVHSKKKMQHVYSTSRP
ncbi:hypothetical protein DPC56_03810 [Methanothermobacter tenebrarum]|uniref:Uncharacterized protein n=1 Tax=Methanothermobacter tenebrarum TaxID=680118 RepID=A0A328PCD8_9EURY|nr:hypothetical protein DPC56_03810 [Methanothermobacter tenebrarum]